MCTCTRTHTCTTHGGKRPPRETSLERAERRWHEALNRGAEPVAALAAAEEVIHELKLALHGSVRAA
jgi:hypothetical protein